MASGPLFPWSGRGMGRIAGGRRDDLRPPRDLEITH